MKVLIWDNSDGGVSNTVPTNSFKVIHKDKTEDQILDIIQGNEQVIDPGATNFIRIQENQFPPDRVFRGAWEIFGGTMRENMAKARIIHQGRINFIKDREVGALVKEIVIQQALGNSVTELQGDIQGILTAIDNVGPNINAAGTPAILRAVWPAGLPTE